jgi:hypothetical protein
MIVVMRRRKAFKKVGFEIELNQIFIWGLMKFWILVNAAHEVIFRDAKGFCNVFSIRVSHMKAYLYFNNVDLNKYSYCKLMKGKLSN